tara:strand:- start:567 stop:839 length:273 start_codon:yes stop_codon:yes gene_type:complete
MKRFIIIFLVIFLIIVTSIIKNSTRELETKIFNSQEKKKILVIKKEMVMLQNNYLSSPQRLFELKKKFFEGELEAMQLKKFKYLYYDEKR